MKKIIVMTVIVCCLLAVLVGCGVTNTVKEYNASTCFKDYITFNTYIPTETEKGYELTRPKHYGLSLENFLVGNSIPKLNYIQFLIFTEKLASEIIFNSFSFDVIAEETCQMEFSLGLLEKTYYTTISANANVVTQVKFENFAYREWTVGDAGDSKLSEHEWDGETGSMMSTLNANSLLNIKLVNLKEVGGIKYSISNLVFGIEGK